MPAPDAILQLVQRFTDQISSYHAARYNETETRRELIDPLFHALGWDVDNSQHYAEAYKDVIHEDAIKIGGVTKAPDYAFRIGGTRKFFVEAKKPSVNVRDDITPAFQLRRYAWTAKLPLSILTDFEEFAVYDCRQKPDKTDKPSTGRVLYLNYKDYVHRWDEIAGIFSHDAILKGSFDRYAEENRGKRGTTDVDDAFLAEIEHWRYLLAHNIALRNNLSQRELNYAVQMTVDRIIFLRICEDRGIEQYGRLQALINGGEVYPRLVGLFRYADQRYNSGLFHFNPEKGQQDAPDGLTPALQIDDKTLKEIIGGLYYPESPYEFSVMPANILGQVYEQFLGKVIRKTSDNRAVVEDKPEVKKAGGVYYTPTYIVDYIVKHTVGALLEGKIPGDMGVGRGEPLRVLDPACGSGSFLLGAYQYLLDWYRDGYIADGAEKWCKGKNPTLYQSQGGGWKLTTTERKRILLEHIYGVDIDSQAVEVTKLSLLLKVLEGESEQSLQSMLDFYKERVLPNLGQNIKCGNSLIGPDFYTQGTQLAFFDTEEQFRINAFDWQSQFSQVFMHSGGFDAVIGNPPYIRIQALKEWAPKEVEFYKKKYTSASKGNYDIYVVFVEKGFSLLNNRGHLGFILPSKFFTTDYGEILRGIISKSLSKIVDFGHTQIFENATTYTCLLFLEKIEPKTLRYNLVNNINLLNSSDSETLIANEFNNLPWVFQKGSSSSLNEKIQFNSLPLSALPMRIGRGSSTGLDKAFILKEIDDCLFTSDGKRIDIEFDILRIPIYASDFGRFSFLRTNQERIIFPYVVNESNYSLIPENDFQKTYPKTYKYLSTQRIELLKRKQYKTWFSFSAPRNLDVHDKADLLVPLLANKGLFCQIENNSQNYCLMASGGFSITLGNESNLSPKYVLGLLNSKLLFWRLEKISNKFRGGWITCTKQYIETLPIHNIDFSNPANVKNHDRMVALVERMLALHKQVAVAAIPQEKDMLQRQIESTDREIDRLVYDLYGLTKDEIKIVEGDDQRP